MFFCTGGAAVKAGVHEGDRIIKVFTTFCFSCWTRALEVFCVADFLLCHVLHVLSQVNGSLVSSMSHQEVVKLIKCEFK